MSIDMMNARKAAAAKTSKILRFLQKQGAELRRLTQYVGTLTQCMMGSEGHAKTPVQSEPELRRTVVFAQYPAFAGDYPWLRANGYITETAEGLVWNKSKQSLAEYLGRQEPPGKKRRWEDIERLFGVRRLANSLSRNRDIFPLATVGGMNFVYIFLKDD